MAVPIRLWAATGGCPNKYCHSLNEFDMILSRRKVHFFSFIALSCLLPICFLAGVFLRPSYDAVEEPELFAKAGFAAASQKEEKEEISSQVIGADNIQLQAASFRQKDGKVVLEIEPSSALEFADLLVYWQAGSNKPEAIANSSILLGSLAGTSRRRFSLPPTILGKNGHLLLYSQGQKTLAVAIELPAEMTDSKR